MPASLESIRRVARIEPTPQAKGIALAVTVTAYDSGMIAVNGRPMNHDGDQAEGWLAAAAHVIEQMQELRRQAAQR